MKRKSRVACGPGRQSSKYGGHVIRVRSLGNALHRYSYNGCSCLSNGICAGTTGLTAFPTGCGPVMPERSAQRFVNQLSGFVNVTSVTSQPSCMSTFAPPVAGRSVLSEAERIVRMIRKVAC